MRLRILGGGLAVLAAVSYSSFVLSHWTGSRVSTSRAFISDLEDPGQPWNWLYRGSDVVAGLAMLGLAMVLARLLPGGRYRRWGTVALAVAGLGSVVDGGTSIRCAGSIDAPCAAAERNPGGMLGQLGQLHADSGVFGLLGIAVAGILLGAVIINGRPRMGALWVVLGAAVGVFGALDAVLLLTGGDIGIAERVRTVLSSVWLLAVGQWLVVPGLARRRLRSSPIVEGVRAAG